MVHSVDMKLATHIGMITARQGHVPALLAFFSSASGWDEEVVSSGSSVASVVNVVVIVIVVLVDVAVVAFPVNTVVVVVAVVVFRGVDVVLLVEDVLCVEVSLTPVYVIVVAVAVVVSTVLHQMLPPCFETIVFQPSGVMATPVHTWEPRLWSSVQVSPPSTLVQILPFWTTAVSLEPSSDIAKRAQLLLLRL